MNKRLKVPTHTQSPQHHLVLELGTKMNYHFLHYQINVNKSIEAPKIIILMVYSDDTILYSHIIYI